ncbi:hypothetical protein R3P38DRAFT_3067630 [Favolaschia claudopus]|uniref:Uncharacterized protein n=1 Tax=Favolaschia claudopus TaxID=2862362 RepID=A0AAW0A0W3_9AGAR
MELRCQQGCMDPMPPHEPGQPFPRRAKAVKYGPHCQCSRKQPYIPRRMRYCHRHNCTLFSPGCDCNQVYQRDGRSDFCQQHCNEQYGLPARKYHEGECLCKPKKSSERRCANGCVDSAGKRAIKYGESCKCVDPRRNPGYRSNCECTDNIACVHRSRLPTVDKRARNSQAKQIARNIDREPRPPKPALHTISQEEYSWMPFEQRKARLNAEKRARDREWSTRYAIQQSNLLNYIEPKYVSQATQVEVPLYTGGPMRVSFDLWRCPVHTAVSTTFDRTPPPICGQIFDLRKIADSLPNRSSVALMETSLRQVFNQTICGHIREHLNNFGLDFDSNGIGLLQNACRALVLYVPPSFP